MAGRAAIILKFTAGLFVLPAIPFAQPVEVIEQEIWTAPLGQSPEQQIWLGPDEGGGAAARVADILGICLDGQTLAQPVQEACTTALASLVAADGDRRLQAMEMETAASATRQELDRLNSAHIVSVFQEQQLQARVMFWVSIGIVLLGVVAAGFQFYLASSGKERSELDLTIQKDQFRVKTAWIGVVLFAMSIALLVSYLYFVFDINFIE